jgi:hypothetical protein
MRSSISAFFTCGGASRSWSGTAPSGVLDVAEELDLQIWRALGRLRVSSVKSGARIAYVIARGGEHGKGLSSLERHGFDAGERLSLFAKEDPKGVRDRSRIAVCKPSFFTIESG